jgi:hypothetical protein
MNTQPDQFGHSFYRGTLIRDLEKQVAAKVPEWPGAVDPYLLLHSFYRGTLIRDLKKQVAAKVPEWPGAVDPYLLLGSAKQHLANRVMQEGDATAWWILDDLMEEIAKGGCQ